MSAPLSEAAAVGRARQMSEGGWSVKAIQEYLARRGVTRSWATIHAWVNPAVAERRRVDTLRRQRERWALASGGRLGRRDQSPELRQFRIEQLRNEVGLSVSSIARVMSFDYPEQPVTESQIRHALATGRYPTRVLVAK